MKQIIIVILALIPWVLNSQTIEQITNPADLVNPLMGTQSKFSLSNGNTYPAIALPWGMNFWVPQTGKMGDGWVYTYDADKIRGFRQTHQPSPWINDYGQFSLLPMTGTPKIIRQGLRKASSRPPAPSNFLVESEAGWTGSKSSYCRFLHCIGVKKYERFGRDLPKLALLHSNERPVNNP